MKYEVVKKASDSWGVGMDLGIYSLNGRLCDERVFNNEKEANEFMERANSPASKLVSYDPGTGLRK